MAKKFLDGTGLQYTLTGFIQKADARYLGKNENAVSASKLSSSRKINNTVFNGTEDIVTAIWGAERTITIGSQSIVVNGSQDITFNLADMGAATIQSVTQLKQELLGGEAELNTLKKLADEIEEQTTSIREEIAAKTAQATNSEVETMLSIFQ